MPCPPLRFLRSDSSRESSKPRRPKNRPLITYEDFQYRGINELNEKLKAGRS